MNNYDIILLDRSLNVSEYKQLYDSLLKDETVKIKWNPPYIYKYIDKLKLKLEYLTKSSKLTGSWCKQQFKYSRILFLKDNEKKGEDYLKNVCSISPPESNEYDQSFIIPTIGRNAHFVCDKVWDILNIEKIKSYKYMEDISNYIYHTCLSFIPNDEIARSVYEYYFKQYANFQSNRITEIINEKGLKCDKYILPAYREVKIENKYQRQSGVIDNIDLLLDDSYGITDYKFGRPHYYHGSKWDRIGIDIEIGDYYSLLQGEPYRVISDDEMVSMEDIIVTKGRILYLRDWENTYEYHDITSGMIEEAQRIEGELIECINTGSFYRRISQYCMQNCIYQRICEKAKRWQDKWNQVKDILKIEMFSL